MTVRFNNAQDFINMLALLIEKQRDKRKKQEEYLLNNMDTTFKLGQIPSDYSGGRPRIIFEGESTASLKAYPYLASYNPAAGDVVLLARVGNSYVVLGKRI